MLVGFRFQRRASSGSGYRPHILTFVLAVAGIYGESDLAFDAALVAALISFSATVITAKFLGRERVL
jgi:multisubunit Na+/H+ antiporter MnhF subunit